MIGWTNVTRRLGDLKPNPHNPRFILEADAARLDESVEEYGQVETLAIGPDDELYNGHQRVAVWLRKYGPDYRVDVRQSDRPLTHDEWRKLVILLHAGATGSWDMDAIANLYEVEELREWGFPEWGLPGDEDDEDDEEQEDDGRDDWPELKLRLAPDTMRLYRRLIKAIDGADEAERFGRLLEGYRTWTGIT